MVTMKFKAKKFELNSGATVISGDDDIKNLIYKCDKCGDTLTLPRDYKEGETLFCPIDGSSYIPDIDKLRRKSRIVTPR